MTGRATAAPAHRSENITKFVGTYRIHLRETVLTFSFQSGANENVFYHLLRGKKTIIYILECSKKESSVSENAFEKMTLFF